jgi:hypothetical protein
MNSVSHNHARQGGMPEAPYFSEVPERQTDQRPQKPRLVLTIPASAQVAKSVPRASLRYLTREESATKRGR